VQGPAGSVPDVAEECGRSGVRASGLADLSLGISPLVSTGDKYDVSGNDMLLWWERDEATAVPPTARLAEVLPEVAEVDLNPVIASERDVRIPDARIRLEPREPVDPLIRMLRT
jgi:hypothetical protein